MPEEAYLVVISIFEGKNFPRRFGYHLIVACTFDGELLSSDPVDHARTPEFTAELAWELDKKVLHQHKMQRTPIKLQCFAVNTTNGQRELLGYILLDLRMAQLTPTEPRWYNLLSRKYSNQKSAIKVGISLENVSASQDDLKRMDGRQTSRQFTVKIDEKARYFQIGSSDKHQDMFVLSVTIMFAVNLEQLVPADLRLTSGNSGYFFFYTLLENDVIEDSFPDLLNPVFIPRRTSLRIRSSLDMLKELLTCGPGLQIHLCSSEHSLGSADIPLKNLFDGASRNISTKPLEVDGAFILRPPHFAENEELESMGAKVRVAVSLCQEAMPQDPADWSALAREAMSGKPSCAATSSEDKGKEIRRNGHIPETDITAGALHSMSLEETANSVTADVNTTCSGETNTLTTSNGTNTMKASAATNSASTNLTTSVTHLAIPPQARHFRFSQHLLSIENLDLPTLSSAYLKYSYPFFGSAAPVLINIPEGIRKGIDFKLSRSLCNFDFACTPSLLQNTFSHVPLDIELWGRNSESDDVLIATAVMPLEQLLVQKPVHYLVSGEAAQRAREGIKLSFQTKLAMKMIHQPLRKVGWLQVSVCLEDMGSVLERKMLSAQKYLAQRRVPV